jgi:hypothetical protein
MVEVLHQAARSLRRPPAFSGSVVTIMALRIDPCTSMFNICPSHCIPRSACAPDSDVDTSTLLHKDATIDD